MSKNLLNSKTISKKIVDVEPTKNQINASKRWIELIESNQLENETSAYIEFALTILRDLLNYNIHIEELKHEERKMEFLFKDSSKSDLVVFELKGTKTKDLWKPQGRAIKIRETPVNQINDYMYKHKIPYGVLTNYKEFILFKREEGYMKYHKIDFLDIKKNPDKLKEFILIFSKDSFEEDKTTKLYKDSVIEERNLTKEFYKLYHETRLMILKEFRESELENEICLHSTQLFLNRLMFIFFAEDTSLLDKRYFESKILEILDKNSGIIDGYTDYVFGKIKSMFRELDKEIPKQIKGFNGELFKEEIDRRLSFKDYRNKPFFKDVKKSYRLDKDIELYENERKIFNKHKNRLSKIIENILLMASFDFKSEVNVNILGHVFEQSISDIENLKEEKISKRKQDGVFYTPEYITDYICRNTIIPYLSKGGTNDINELLDEYSDDIEDLEEKFKSIKILDPACGSGAFLIKATEILFEIFENIQSVKENYGDYHARRGLKMKSNIKGQLTLKKFDEKEEIKNIIENNIYGVDINEESVEITKLSLFLKIARKNKKLIDLSNNIKRGNSLIDDSGVAGDLAFDWEKEFPEIMSNGGFDVVIGNPPYVEARSIEQKYVDFMRKNYETSGNRINTFASFIEKGINLSKDNSYFSFIIHRNLIRSNDYQKTRNFILNNTKIKQILSFTQGVFEGVTGEMTILILNKTKEKKETNQLLIYEHTNKITPNLKPKKIKQNVFNNTAGNRFNIYLTNEKIDLLNKIKENCVKMGDIAETLQGIIVGNEKKYVSKDKKNEKYKPILRGKSISRYGFPNPLEYVYYVSGTKVLTRGKTPELFEKDEKILTQHVSGDITATLDTQQNYFLQTINSTTSINEEFKNRYLLGLLNSKLINFYYSSIFNLGAEFTTAVAIENLDELPIKKISKEIQKSFIEKVNLMLSLNKEFYEKKNKFFNRIKKSFGLEKINKKLDKFYELSSNSFIEEIEKQTKNKISLKEQDEWEDYFKGYKNELSKLKEKINETDKEIDERVYKLYNITDKEKEIIENS